MATTHATTRSRQRPTRRTPMAHTTAHARAHRAGPARQDRSDVAPALATPQIEVVERVVATPKAGPLRASRTTDADDHLAAYFRQLAAHELLTPEDERELSQGIEDTEVLTWERVFSRAEVINAVLALVEPNLEQPVKFPKLVKAADDLLKSKRAGKDPKLAKKLTTPAKEAALQLRALDLDRVHIDAVMRELFRARQAALAGRPRGGPTARRRRPVPTSTASARPIATRWRCATSSCARTCASWSRWRVVTIAAACRSPI